MITSYDNKQIKQIEKLLKNSRNRKKEGLFVVEGRKMVIEAIRTGNAKKVYFSSKFEDDKAEWPDFQTIEEAETFAMEGREVEGEIVEEGLFKKISDTSTPQGIMAVVKFDMKTDEEIYEDGKFLALEDVRDPGNIGTIIRSCEAAGIDGIIVSKGCCDIYSPKVSRSTMGSLFRVPVYHCENFVDSMGKLRYNMGYEVFGTSMVGASKFNSIIYPKRCVVIIGNEANGMSDECMKVCSNMIYIPMAGNVESLNAGVAASLIMYEMNRNG